MILNRFASRSDACNFIWESEPLEPDENGVLTALCSETALYVAEDGTGDENGYYLVLCYYTDEGDILDQDLMRVLYICAPPDENGRVEILAARYYNDQTLTRSSRAEFDEEYLKSQDYDHVLPV